MPNTCTELECHGFITRPQVKGVLNCTRCHRNPETTRIVQILGPEPSNTLNTTSYKG